MIDDLDNAFEENGANQQEASYERYLKIISRGSDVFIDEFTLGDHELVVAYASEQCFKAADNNNWISVTDRNCAEYVKRFYEKVYGIDIEKLPGGETPAGLHRVLVPQPGDVMYIPSPHWAIVKQVNADGTVTVIEQNCVFKYEEGYAVWVNDTYDISEAKFYRGD